MGWVGAAVVAAWGVLLGTLPLNDNSFFTHLATGRLILDRGSVPSADPYSFTAAGVDWVVQSWLASVVFAGAEEIGGAAGVRLVVAVLAVAIVLLVWSLSSPARSLVARSAIVLGALLASAGSLGERPLLFGVLGFLLTLRVAEGRLDPRWLIPVFWVWVNTHGSFPLGIVYLIAVVVGRRMDRDDTRVAVRATAFAVAGTALGAVSPVGPRILTFPIDLLRRRELLGNVVEWQAPDFTGVPQLAALGLVVCAIVALVRRPSFQRAVPFAIFLAAALLGARNVGLLAFVTVLLLAEAVPEVGTLRSDSRSRLAVPLTVAIAGLSVLLGLVRLQGDDYSLQAYPVRALAFVEERSGASEQLVGREVVGNLQELIYGPEVAVFVDDRFDMYPEDVLEDTFELVREPTNWREILSGYEANTVVWQTEDALARILIESPDWQVVYSDRLWLVAVRR